MSDLTVEELALLAAQDAEEPKRRPRTQRQAPAATEAAPAVSAQPRGTAVPVQFEGDGWGDTPVQMRG